MADVTAHSTGGLFPHTHTLVVPASALAAPAAEGVTLTTSEEVSAFFFKHTHPVKLSKEDLERIASGEDVIVHDAEAGRHSFVIKK
ncbi:hypothetical protein HDU84_002719 [Entophlyctis sp. JEL0112]|nr:hypothetical protein HDU84_002719 [Entophlyctis sp. JEL0112]